MRAFLFALMLVPVIGFAQADSKDGKIDPTEVKSDGKLNFVHANKVKTQPAVRKEGDKRKLKEDEIYVGDVTFHIGGNDLKADSAILYTNDGVLSMYNFSVSNPVSFMFKGENLVFTKETAKAMLQSGIKITALNGDVLGTSESMEIDFGYEIGKVIAGSITPLEPEKK